MIQVEDSNVEPIHMNQDDGEESELDDTGIWDCSAASVLVSRMQIKKYLRSLLMIDFDVHQINTKGFKFGNGNRDKTSLCVLLPTWFQGIRRDIPVYVITGKVSFLLGRPLMEKLNVSIDYADKMIKWGGGEWRPAPLGPKGEYVLHLAENAAAMLDAPIAETLVPEDFYDHVQLERERYIMDMIQDLGEINNVEDADDDEVQPETSQSKLRQLHQRSPVQKPSTRLGLQQGRDSAHQGEL